MSRGMNPNRYLSTYQEFEQDTYDRQSPESYPGQHRIPQRMTRQAVYNTIHTVMQVPEVFEVYDVMELPGIEIVSSVPGEGKITVRRILGLTTADLNLPKQKGY